MENKLKGGMRSLSAEGFTPIYLPSKTQRSIYLFDQVALVANAMYRVPAS